MKNHIYCNEPVKLDRKEYDVAIKHFVDEISKLEDVKSIYKIGSIKAPGISDIDLVLVLNDKVKHPRKLNEDVDNLIKSRAACFVHEPLIFKESHFKRIRTIVPVFDMDKVWGKTIAVDKKKSKELRLIHMIDKVNDGLTRNFLEGIHLTKNTKQIEQDTRFLLCRLHTIRYNIQLVKDITGISKKLWRDYIKEIDHLRSKWHDLMPKRYNLLNKLLEKELVVANELTTTLAKYLRDKGICTMDDTVFASIENYPRTNFYFKDIDAEQALEKVKKVYWETGISSTILPIEYLVQLLSHPNVDTILDKKTLKNLRNSNLKYSHKYEALVKERYNLILDYNKWIKENGIIAGPLLKFGVPSAKNKLKNFLLGKRRLAKAKRFVS